MRDVTAGNRCFLYEHSFFDTVSGDDRNLENLNIAQHKGKEKGRQQSGPSPEARAQPEQSAGCRYHTGRTPGIQEYRGWKIRNGAG
ncbi:hypothetical protein [Faecalibaculum rodentium]|uniref:hypothetical protein n=1 Tax=Faecalibaculum rodentium TaxID=1702221 RepID=UPI00117AECC4|nr:hypothetical protein [Faecalibaculum rodentium]